MLEVWGQLVSVELLVHLALLGPRDHLVHRVTMVQLDVLVIQVREEPLESSAKRATRVQLGHRDPLVQWVHWVQRVHLVKRDLEVIQDTRVLRDQLGVEVRLELLECKDFLDSRVDVEILE